jgi:hypothetical protein
MLSSGKFILLECVKDVESGRVRMSEFVDLLRQRERTS